MLNYFIGAGQEFLLLLPLLIIFIAGMLLLHHKKGYETPILHLALLLLFLACMQGIVYVTGSATVGDLVNWREGLLRAETINLIPLRWGIGDPFGFVMNIFLFIPIGFLLPLLWKRFAQARNTVLTGFLLSLIIETGQLFNNRATDVDDLLTNTIGTVVGYLCYKLLGQKLADKFPMRVHGKYYSKMIYSEGGLWIVIIFLCNFFIMPFVRKALWGVFF